MILATEREYKLDWVTDSLAVGQAPMSYEALDRLRDLGIGAILNLCAEFCDLHWIQADAGFEVYYFPIPDEEAPDPAELDKALDWLDECLFLGKKVLVHCRYGIGRTGTVVNAYLLRKGLGHKLAGKKLKGLKSQPANFNQWWFLRKYGKKEKPLTIRAPALETQHLVDIFPFFQEYEKVLRELDGRLARAGKEALCGRGHARCCGEPVTMSFIETVYVNHVINTTLGRVTRQEAVQRALEVSRAVRGLERREATDFRSAGFAELYRQARLLCPLNELGDCLIFANRPVACRLFDMTPQDREELGKTLPDEVAEISGRVYAAFTSHPLSRSPFSFLLPEVVSGRFVQTFFHHLMQNSLEEPGGL